MKSSTQETVPLQEQALDLCLKGMSKQLTPSEIKLATWLVGSAYYLGGFPVEFSIREIQLGCTRGNITLEGWGAHARTINAALKGLEEKQVISVSEGLDRPFGHVSKLFNTTPTSIRG